MRVMVGIVGSREFADLGMVKRFVAALPEGCNVVSGGGRGVDTVAESEARARGWEPVIHPATIKSRYADKSAVARALLERNGLIVRDADVVVAFWDGKSSGTLDTIQKAREAGKRLFIVQDRTMVYNAALDHVKHLVDIERGLVNVR